MRRHLSAQLCHWRYVLDNVIAPVKAVSCMGRFTFRRWDGRRAPTIPLDAMDAAYAT
jgi:hypothetical protein